jgi:hypothetical protein
MLPLVIGPWQIALPFFLLIVVVVVLIVNSSVRRKRRNKAMMNIYKNTEKREAGNSKVN